MILEKLTNAMMRIKKRFLEGLAATMSGQRITQDSNNNSSSSGSSSNSGLIMTMSLRHHRVTALSCVTTLSLILVSLLLVLIFGSRTSVNSNIIEQHGGELNFPSLDDTLEMAQLSNLIYDFHDVEHDDDVCVQINAGNYSSRNNNNNNNNNSTTNHTATDDDDDDSRVDVVTNNDWHCHWYRHERDKQGTQVMIISSHVQNYVAIIFAGTDDVRTSLTDADILTQPFGDVSCVNNKNNNSNSNGTTASNSTTAATTAATATTTAVTATTRTIYNWTLPSNDNDKVGSLKNLVKIHAGFDNAVFCQGNLFAQLVQVFDSVYHDKLLEQQQERRRRWWWWRRQRQHIQPLRLFATGHSLGAATSVLTAVALTDHYVMTTATQSAPSSSSAVQQDLFPFYMHVINFGCPQMGNTAWRDYVNDYSTILKKHLSIWRVVLGWDLVPRLPSVSFYHVGHTVQLSHEYEQEIKNDHNTNNVDRHHHQQQQDERLASSSSLLDNNHNMNDSIDDKENASNSHSSDQDKNSTAKKLPFAVAYYHHYGNETLGYAGVPTGWSSMPYIWVPGAVESHHITHYVAFLQALQRKQQQQRIQQDGSGDNHTAHFWIKKFVNNVDDNKKKHQNNGNDDERPPNVDDDFWDNPPDKDFDSDNAQTTTPTTTASTSAITSTF
jgi:Lipase (class 3)